MPLQKDQVSSTCWRVTVAEIFLNNNYEESEQTNHLIGYGNRYLWSFATRGLRMRCHPWCVTYVVSCVWHWLTAPLIPPERTHRITHFSVEVSRRVVGASLSAFYKMRYGDSEEVLLWIPPERAGTQRITHFSIEVSRRVVGRRCIT